MLKKEPKIGIDQIVRLLKRSRKDLVTAKKLLDEDLGLAISAIYDAMFHAANALIRMQGYRPGDKSQHVGVVEAVRRTLGNAAKNLIIKFDDLRIARNRFEYQAIFDMSKAQLEKALEDAENLVKVITLYIQEKHPQKEFKF
jgi:uncharacterized protein (UPF0332 family)